LKRLPHKCLYTFLVFSVALIMTWIIRDLLLYVKGVIIKTYEGVDADLHALDAGEWSASVLYLRRKNPGYPQNRRLAGLEAVA
jgi:hypothetical protein